MVFVTLMFEPQIAAVNLADRRASVLPDFVNPGKGYRARRFGRPLKAFGGKLQTIP
jgi:hypothetical protein